MEALGLFPTYGEALEEDIRLALDEGRAADAVTNAERLAWSDRERAGVRELVGGLRGNQPPAVPPRGPSEYPRGSRGVVAATRARHRYRSGLEFRQNTSTG